MIFRFLLRFVRELHSKLMDQARATHFSDPGEFRKSQNWIGGTRPDNARFVPPPVPEMHRALDDLERLHACRRFDADADQGSAYPCPI